MAAKKYNHHFRIELVDSPISEAKPFKWPLLACEIKNLIKSLKRVLDVIKFSSIYQVTKVLVYL